MSSKGIAGLVGLLFGVLCGAAVPWFGLRTYCPGTATTSLNSPDDLLRIVLKERGTFLDRNFDVLLESTDGRIAAKRVFSSPDEGRPIGSERFLWSNDGSHVLLVGRHFYVDPLIVAPNGETAYLLLRVRDGRQWCNASQLSESRITIDLLSQAGITEKFTNEPKDKPDTQ